jgi:hypothetical protein
MKIKHRIIVEYATKRCFFRFSQSFFIFYEYMMMSMIIFGRYYSIYVILHLATANYCQWIAFLEFVPTVHLIPYIYIAFVPFGKHFTSIHLSLWIRQSSFSSIIVVFRTDLHKMKINTEIRFFDKKDPKLSLSELLSPTYILHLFHLENTSLLFIFLSESVKVRFLPRVDTFSFSQEPHVVYCF